MRNKETTWRIAGNVLLYASSPHQRFSTSKTGELYNRYARVAELADAHVWGACGLSLGVRVPSLAPEGKSVFDLPFFYKQKWWNGRHAGFRHQFPVSEGSSPFFCITWKSAWILENSVFVRIFCICGLSNTIKYYRILTDICTYLLSESLQKVFKLYRANLRESPLKRHESPRGCVDRLFCEMV